MQKVDRRRLSALVQDDAAPRPRI